jgi:hypothetical protein
MERIKMNSDQDREERLRDAVGDITEQLNESELSMRDRTMIGATLAISGLAEDVSPDAVVVRFPTFVDMLNLALETYQGGLLVVEATIIKREIH